MTKSLGKELARSGISVSAVAPAAVRTAIFDQMTKAHIEFMLSKIPIGRFGTVEENAALISWLTQSRMLLLHRRGIRYFRRPLYLLEVCRTNALASCLPLVPLACAA
jgi:NAD(P)-dependent dehydrogenase (short-subunit alcohol dehydrogenase family)